MCDYSLHGMPNRLAEEGEVLVVHRFLTGSKGLTSPEYLKPTAPPKGLIAMLKSVFAFPNQFKACAVCVPDGAKLMLYGIPPRLQEAHGLSADEAVTFPARFPWRFIPTETPWNSGTAYGFGFRNWKTASASRCSRSHRRKPTLRLR